MEGMSNSLDLPLVRLRWQFPLDELEVSEFVEGGPAKEAPKYRLTAVVVHVGRGIDTGHYLTLGRDQERGQWCLMLSLQSIVRYVQLTIPGRRCLA